MDQNVDERRGTPRAPRGAVRRRALAGGFALVELMVAIGIMSILVGVVMSCMTRAFSLSEATRGTAQAVSAAEDAIAELTAVDFLEAFARYNADPDDDPDGPGTAPGSGFAVPGLTPLAGDLDGLPGEILFPGGGVTLREDAEDRDLGMPRDLNGDGPIDDLDHGDDYRVLPVRVRVRWREGGRNRQIELVVTLARMI